ncbi:MAG: 3-deoxy-7-phosphoheptulonate synthase [bacterium]|nr:3-deoxy-7-phosphoheptulonate synthase [bacterium]
MGFKQIQEIPTPNEVLDKMPLPEDLRRIKAERDAEIRAIFERKSDKFLLVIGPCSADHEDAVCEYVGRLARLQEEVRDKLVLVPRVYTNKPRTTGEGYKGMGHQPDPQKEPNIAEGIYAVRQMHIRVIRESHLTAADEMLYPNNLPYVEDLLSYIAVGARSVENQQHRLTCSGVNVPVGMKNPTAGDLSVMLNAIYASQIPHVFIYNGWEVCTDGNPLTHAVLRGWLDVSGRSVSNYHYEDLAHVAEAYRDRNLANPAIVVDTNHNNSAKQFDAQPRIGLEVMRSRQDSELLNDMVRGLMVESYLEEGAQKVDGGVYGKSITDPCLGWEASEVFVKRLAEVV